MAIRIAQASCSETGGKYGVAPNQKRTGVTASKPQGNLDGELNVINFSGGWECVYRAYDEVLMEKMANFMYNAVANGSHIGYSQDNTRFGVFDALKNQGITDPAKITSLVNCDCATLVGAAIYYSGLHLDGLRGLVTWRMNDVLLNSGAFYKIATKELCQEGKGIRKGDILWREGHTAIAIDNDTRVPRLSLDDRALRFADSKGNTTGYYPADAKSLLRDNELKTVNLYGNTYYVYGQTGSATYNLETDATYLVTYVQRNSTNTKNDSVWVVSAHKSNSHILPIKEGSATASIDKLRLTVTRPNTYGRVTVTRLN